MPANADRSAPADLPSDPIEAALLVVPPVPKGAIRRPRLEERLDEGMRGPLTLVAAPAGTGKTVLVSSWASHVKSTSTVVWMSLDDAAMSPGPFWHLLASGLARRGLDVPAVSSGRDAADSSFTASIADQIVAHDEPVVLILDCDGIISADLASRLDSLI